MQISKKRVIQILEKILKENEFISDIWFYGSFKDRISDIDLIIIYNSHPEKIILPKILNEKIYGGTIIYVPKKFSHDIFLFENLKIFSIKKKKKIIPKLSKNFRALMLLTSFLERYYERRTKLRIIKNNISEYSIRDIKSLIMSYDTFNQFCNLKKIPKIKNNFMQDYVDLRKHYLKTNKTEKFSIFINKIKAFDKIFKINSFKILDKIFPDKNKSSFSFKFDKINFYYKNYIKRNVPFVYGCLYYFYSSQSLELSKKLKKDLKSSSNLNVFDLSTKKFLFKKINFLNECYLDLKKQNFKKGLYRLTWYL